MGNRLQLSLLSQVMNSAFSIRHAVICSLQMTSLLLTAFAESVPAALLGVCVASLAGGFGETTYLGLAGHYSKWVYRCFGSG